MESGNVNQQMGTQLESEGSEPVLGSSVENIETVGNENRNNANRLVWVGLFFIILSAVGVMGVVFAATRIYLNNPDRLVAEKDLTEPEPMAISEQAVMPASAQKLIVDRLLLNLPVGWSATFERYGEAKYGYELKSPTDQVTPVRMLISRTTAMNANGGLVDIEAFGQELESKNFVPQTLQNNQLLYIARGENGTKTLMLVLVDP